MSVKKENKAVMISIGEEYQNLLTKPVIPKTSKPNIKTPFKVYLYLKLPKYGDMRYEQGKVIGELTCDSIALLPPLESLIFGLEYEVCLSKEELKKLPNGNQLYGWHTSNVVIYDNPKELSEFHKCTYYNGSPFCRQRRYCDGKSCVNPLSTPPKGWCYIEA